VKVEAFWRGCWKRQATPSTTSAYGFDSEKALFAADTLFSIGCDGCSRATIR